MLQHHSEAPPWLSAKDQASWQTDRESLSESWRERDERSFDELEIRLQYGYAAARYFGQRPWDDIFEEQLRSLWPGDWEVDVYFIRIGWDWGTEP